MYGWRGILTGALALIIVQAVLEHAETSELKHPGTGGAQVDAVLGFANWVSLRFIDPKVPAIPPRTKAPLAPPAGATYRGPNASSSSGTGGGSAPGGGGGGGGSSGGGGSGW